MVYQERTRRRLRAALLLLAVIGLASLGFGVAAPSLAPDVAPVPVPLGEAVRLPDPGPFGGTVALYGAATDATGISPTVELLGCRLSTDHGDGTETGLSERGSRRLDRRVVDGRAMLALLEVQGSAERSIRCDGAGAIGLQPLFLITTTGQRDLVPMAAFSFATLALVLGIAGAVVLRPLDS